MVKEISPYEYEGTTIQGFRIDRLRGTGPVTCTFSGTQTALARTVSLRMLRPAYARHATHVAEFLEGGRTAARLLHASILPIFNVISDGDLHCIAQEYLDAPTLQTFDRDHPLSIEQVLDIGAELIDALEFAHGQGVVHANLRPCNIFLDGESKIRIADFAPGRRYLVPGSLADPRVPYMAPELFSNQAPGWVSDIFSVGCVLYVLLTGRTPYPAEAIFSGGVGEAPACPPASALNPSVRPPLDAQLRRMLGWHPTSRPQTMRALAADWRGMIGELLALEQSRSSIRIDLGAPDKRRYRRLRSEMQVEVSVLHATPEMTGKLEGMVGNISENGAYVPTRTPLPVGTIVSLSFRLAENREAWIRAIGVVRWLEETRASRGMGVQFIQVTTEDRTQLREFVDDVMLTEMIRVLTATPLHRKFLRRLVIDAGGRPMTLQELLRGTGAGQTLALRALKDFEQFRVVRLEGEVVHPQPLGPRVGEILFAAGRRVPR